MAFIRHKLPPSSARRALCAAGLLLRRLRFCQRLNGQLSLAADEPAVFAGMDRPAGNAGKIGMNVPKEKKARHRRITLYVCEQAVRAFPKILTG